MIIKPLKIISVGSYVQSYKSQPEQNEELVDLKPLVKALSGKVIRRLTRFVQLALIGALRCSQHHQVSASTGVYLSSCRGDIAVTVELLDELVREKQPPSPMTFVNSVSNAACFHVAAALGLHGKSNFVTNRYDPWVAAAKLAQIDLQSDDMHTALVGSVDSMSLPFDNHRQRLNISEAAPIADASHWMLLADEYSAEPAIAMLEAIHQFADESDLMAWLKTMDVREGDILGVGQHLTAEQFREITQQILTIPALLNIVHANVEQFADTANINKQGLIEFGEEGYYDSPTGECVIKFISDCSETRLLHVNADPFGRFTVMVVSIAR